jgi:hypothetical protein
MEESGYLTVSMVGFFFPCILSTFPLAMMSFLSRLTTLAIFAGHSLPRAVQAATNESSHDVLDWVDPLIGSRSGGNVFAGATLPYGMAKGQSAFA